MHPFDPCRKISHIVTPPVGKYAAIQAGPIVLTILFSQLWVFKSRPTLWLYVDGRDSADKSSRMRNHINEDVIMLCGFYNGTA